MWVSFYIFAFSINECGLIMVENQNNLLKGAMTYGASLGFYWVFKYLFWMLSLKISMLSVVYLVLTLFVPYVAYQLTKRYKQDIGGRISFFHAWRFGMMLYLFAALIVSLVHFAFYQFFAPHDFLQQAAHQLAEIMQDAAVERSVIDSMQQLNVSPIHMAIQGIFNNIFYGIIFSIPVAAWVSRSQQPTQMNAGSHAVEKQA